MIKVLWGEDWDPLLEKDSEGLLARRMGEVVDGEYQEIFRFFSEGGLHPREHFFGKDPRLLKMAEHLSDEQIETPDETRRP